MGLSESARETPESGATYGCQESIFRAMAFSGVARAPVIDAAYKSAVCACILPGWVTRDPCDM